MSPRLRLRDADHALMIVVYGVLAVGMTLPAWTADAPMIVGEASGLDLTGSIWAHWWAADALQRGVSPFVGDYSFFPSGVSPLLQYNLLDAIIHAPLVAMMGPRLGYNPQQLEGWAGQPGSPTRRPYSEQLHGDVVASLRRRSSSCSRWVIPCGFCGEDDGVCGLVRLVKQRRGVVILALSAPRALRAIGIAAVTGLSLLPLARLGSAPAPRGQQPGPALAGAALSSVISSSVVARRCGESREGRTWGERPVGLAADAHPTSLPLRRRPWTRPPCSSGWSSPCSPSFRRVRSRSSRLTLRSRAPRFR